MTYEVIYIDPEMVQYPSLLKITDLCYEMKTQEKNCTTLLVYGNMSGHVNKTAFLKSKCKVTLPTWNYAHILGNYQSGK